MYKIESLASNELLLLGHHGEHLANTIQIDVSAWLNEWPDASFNILVLRPTEKLPYPANIIVSDNKVLWPITRVETAIVGVGKVEIQAFSGERKRKSAVVGTKVASCICNEEEFMDPPDAYEGWLDTLSAAQANVNDKISQVEALRQTIDSEATQTLEALQATKADAEAAEASAEYWAAEAKAAAELLQSYLAQVQGTP